MMFYSRPRARPVTPPVIKLPANLDMRSAQDLKDRLAAALASNPVLRLDGSETTHVATPGVQLLLAASQTAKSDGGKIVLTNGSAALEAAFQDLGLGNELAEWGTAHV
ncbi:MAG: STAS domain-containing protein [Rhodomicrobium sp.]